MDEPKAPLRPREPNRQEAELMGEALLGARILRPYYAKALACLQPLCCDGIGTIAIGDGYQLFYDPIWFAAQKKEHRAALIACHEVEHVLRKHTDRCIACGATEKTLFNVAGDMEINDDARKEFKSIKPPAVTPDWIKAPDGLMAEEYYQRLLAMAAAMQPKPQCGGGSGAGDPREGEQGGGLSKAQCENVRKQAAEDVVKAHNRNPGNVPAGVIVWARETLAPVRIPWDALLNSLLARHSAAIKAGRMDYSFKRIHRRQRPNTLLRPAPVQYEPRIGVVVDTSGSMGDLGPYVLGTVESIARRFGNVAAYSCDTEVHRMHGPLRQAKWKGGGGTNLIPAIEQAEQVADCVVIVTDGYTPWPAKLARPWIVVLLDEGAKRSVPTAAQIVSVKGSNNGK